MGYDSFDVIIVRETDKALLVRLKDGSEIWLPRSQIKTLVRFGDGAAQIAVPEWLAEDKGMYVQ